MISTGGLSGDPERQYKPFLTCGSCGLAPDASTRRRVDQSLPSRGLGYFFEYRAPTGTWSRLAEHNACGNSRQTAAFAYVRKVDPQIATFTANIPETALWKLDYNIPSVLEREE